MGFEELQNTIKEVLSNDKISKDGLVLVYNLDPINHQKLEEHIFFSNNPTAKKSEFEPMDDFEIDVEDFSILFVKKDTTSTSDEKKNKSPNTKGNIKKVTNTWFSKLKSLF